MTKLRRHAAAHEPHMPHCYVIDAALRQKLLLLLRRAEEEAREHEHAWPAMIDER